MGLLFFSRLMKRTTLIIRAWDSLKKKKKSLASANDSAFDSADSNYHASLSPDAAETAFAQFHRSGPFASHSVEYSVVLQIVGFVPKVKYQAPHYRS